MNYPFVTAVIPDRYYEGGTPRRTWYEAPGDGLGLMYRLAGEDAYEAACAFGGDLGEQFSVVGLLSPWVLGFNTPPAYLLELVAVDIEARTVTYRQVKPAGPDDLTLAARFQACEAGI